MLSINDKLRFITEGYTIEEINNMQESFVNLISESSKSELDIMKLRGTVVDAEKFDKFVKENLRNPQDIMKLRGTVVDADKFDKFIKQKN
jgi:hypothetical protein